MSLSLSWQGISGVLHVEFVISMFIVSYHISYCIIINIATK